MFECSRCGDACLQVVQAGLGADHSVFVTDGGTVLVAGSTRGGRLALPDEAVREAASAQDGGAAERVLQPLPAPGMPLHATHVAVGGSHSLVLCSAGVL